MTDTLFETPDLRVRKLTPADVEDMVAVYGDALAMRWVDDGKPIGASVCSVWITVTERNYQNRGYGMSALVETATGTVVGFCGLVHPAQQQVAEIKYALKRTFWGKGYATQAASGMLDYGSREHGLREIIATIAPENVASQRVLEKVGMRVRGDTRNEDGSVTRTLVWYN